MDRNLHRPELQGTNVLAHQLQPSWEFIRCLALRPFHFISHDIVHLNVLIIQQIYTMSIDIIMIFLNSRNLLCRNALRTQSLADLRPERFGGLAAIVLPVQQMGDNSTPGISVRETSLRALHLPFLAPFPRPVAKTCRLWLPLERLRRQTGKTWLPH